MATEDTQVEEVTQDEAEVIKAWQEAEAVKEPGESIKEKEITMGGMPPGVGMRYTSLESAGWVKVYHQKTGDESIINRNMLGIQLRKKLEDGSKAFDIVPPRDKAGNIIVPKQGTLKCMLNRDDPNREKYDEWGFAVCPKHNLTSRHNLIQHMSHRHPQEWAAIKEERDRLEKEEDKTFQRALYERLAPKVEAKAEEAPLYVSEKPPKPKKKKK